MTEKIRQPAVAGTFYPADPEELNLAIQTYLRAATAPNVTPKAIIVPHAGIIYSGPIAAYAYQCIKPIAHLIERVILLGPSHQVAFPGLALSSATTFLSPLGKISIDHSKDNSLLKLKSVRQFDEAHHQEHSLEVQLPFLQSILTNFTLIPITVGDAETEEVSEVLDLLWGGKETLIVISSDLSHYLAYPAAQQKDEQTAALIESYQGEQMDFESACGRYPIRGLLACAQQKKLKITRLDLRNSGDTTNTKSQVVGYGAWALY